VPEKQSGVAIPTADVIGFSDVTLAAIRLRGRIRTTPIFDASILEGTADRGLSVKAECLQRSGSFKYRGALNAVLAGVQRNDKREVVAVAGNHAIAVALAARECGVRATVVMPKDGRPLKLSLVESLGASVVTSEAAQADREEVVTDLLKRDMRLITPDDPEVMAGAGTLMTELLEQVGTPPPTVVVVPIGMGGLVAGLTIVARELAPSMSIMCGEPALADDAYRSLQYGSRVTLDQTPTTIADGLRAVHLGERAWPIIAESMPRIVRVTEEEIVNAVWLCWTRLKLLVEPSGAVGLAALITDEGHAATSRTSQHESRVVCLLTGGNTDPVEMAPLFGAARARDLAGVPGDRRSPTRAPSITIERR
jgi:threonine dehydratase